MPKSKNPANYAKAYYLLLDRAIDNGSVTVSKLSQKEAKALRFDLYSLRKALVLQLPEVGRRYQRLTFEVSPMHEEAQALPGAKNYKLWIANIDDTPLNKHIMEQLGEALEEPTIEILTEPLPEVIAEAPNANSSMQSVMDSLNLGTSLSTEDSELLNGDIPE